MSERCSNWPDTLEDYKCAMGLLAFEAYQMRLFLQLCKQTIRPVPVDRTYLDDACQYTFYVHLRVILGFFKYTKTVDDDITHCTFKKYLKTSYVAPPRKEFPQTLLESLNKRVAHLSKCRRTEQPTDPEMHDALKYYLNYGDKISPFITDFIENLTPQLQKSFNERTKAFQERDDQQPLTLQSRFRLPK
jgi:hypothetical protein